MIPTLILTSPIGRMINISMGDLKVSKIMKDDPYNNLNQSKRENVNISMGDLKVSKNMKEDSYNYLNQSKRENDNISMEDLKVSKT